MPETENERDQAKEKFDVQQLPVETRKMIL